MNKAILQIGLIGGGNMGSCLVGGIIAHGHPPDKIWVVEHHLEKRQSLEKKWAIPTTDQLTPVIHQVDILVLAIKPQSMQALIEEIAPLIAPNTLVISIAAGITTQQIQQWAAIHSMHIIRAMPNTPALIGKGITALFAPKNISELFKQQAQHLLQAVGETVWIENETLMDVVTALSGSGPAYFFYMMEGFINGAVSLGLTPDIASKLTLQTALGSTLLALADPKNMLALREKVTSPGGTTDQGINALKDGKMHELLLKTLTAATLRGKTLSEQFD